MKSAWNCGVCSLMAPASPRRHRRGGSSRSRALQGRRSRSAHIGHGRPPLAPPQPPRPSPPGPAALGPAAASGLAPPGAQRRRPAPPGTEGRERPQARPHRGGRGPVTASLLLPGFPSAGWWRWKEAHTSPCKALNSRLRSGPVQAALPKVLPRLFCNKIISRF